MTAAAVFLDRDGVLNRPEVRGRRPFPPREDAVEVLPGVVEACARLKKAGLLLIVVTNQPDVARATTTMKTVDAIHERLRAALPIDDFRVCPHDDRDGCKCRKPKPGMLQAAAEEWGVDLRTCVMVGDRWRDIEAGRRAGCSTVFIDRGYDERQPDDPELVVRELIEAIPWMLARLPTGKEPTRT